MQHASYRAEMLDKVSLLLTSFVKRCNSKIPEFSGEISLLSTLKNIRNRGNIENVFSFLKAPQDSKFDKESMFQGHSSVYQV